VHQLVSEGDTRHPHTDGEAAHAREELAALLPVAAAREVLAIAVGTSRRL
jgi:hypothetical protein